MSKEVDSFEIPAVLESLETYIYVGFDDATAKKLWAIYSNYVANADPDDTEGEFIDFARWQVENVMFSDPTSEGDDWVGYMNAIGVSQELQEAIMLPEFSDIRYTASCEFWLLDTIMMRYGSLESLDDRLREKPIRLRGMLKVARTPSFAEPFIPKRTTGENFQKILSPEREAAQLVGDPPASCPTIDPVLPARDLPLQDEPSELALSQPSLSKDDFAKPTTPPLLDEEVPPSQAVDVVTVPASIAGCTMLWRCGSRHSAESFYNPKTRKIRLGEISSRPGDFSGETTVAYWTPQKETADHYARWAKLKAQETELCMIQVAVPDSFTRSLSTKYLWFDERSQPTDEWKKLIWYSRRNEVFPKELAYLYQKDLLIGHIASGKHVKYVRLSDYTRIRESDLLTMAINGEERKAIQWAFHTYHAKVGFAEYCKDKIWLHKLGALKKLELKSDND